MIVKQLDITGDCSRWDEYVTAHPAGTVYHLSAWGRAVNRSMGHRCFYLYVEDQGQVTAVLPLIEVKSLLFGKALISVAFATGGGPLFTDAAALAMLDEQARALTESQGVDYLESRNMAIFHPDWPVKAESYSIFRKELSTDNEENMNAIPRKQRAMVRKGLKFGLKAVIDADPGRMYGLYAESLRNLGSPVFPEKLFSCLKAEYGADCEILTIENTEGKAISSVMAFYFRDEVIPYYGGGTYEARALAANDFMYWSLMERAVTVRQCRIFDFGRSKNSTGAFNFKKNWGFEPQPLYYEFILKDGQQVPNINPLNPKYQMMVRCWKKLPLMVANRIGPLISRSLG